MIDQDIGYFHISRLFEQYDKPSRKNLLLFIHKNTFQNPLIHRSQRNIVLADKDHAAAGLIRLYLYQILPGRFFQPVHNRLFFCRVKKCLRQDPLYVQFVKSAKSIVQIFSLGIFFSGARHDNLSHRITVRRFGRRKDTNLLRPICAIFHICRNLPVNMGDHIFRISLIQCHVRFRRIMPVLHPRCFRLLVAAYLHQCRIHLHFSDNLLQHLLRNKSRTQNHRYLLGHIDNGGFKSDSHFSAVDDHIYFPI